MNIAKIWRVAKLAIPNAHHLANFRTRRCGCCGRLSIFLGYSAHEESKSCVRCRANIRYERLWLTINERCPDLTQLTILELDYRSPLRSKLERAKLYIPTYFSKTEKRGTVRADGARCEDITQLTFDAGSIDLIVSSDVLEHVPDITTALSESARVLKPGGAHLFTVPRRERTRQRAYIDQPTGQLVHLLPPEYHGDPSSVEGILAFWDFALDVGVRFSTAELSIESVHGPFGKEGRVVWCATKITQ